MSQKTPGVDYDIVHDHRLVVINEAERKRAEIGESGNRADQDLGHAALIALVEGAAKETVEGPGR
jgi:hypothetical protein